MTWEVLGQEAALAAFGIMTKVAYDDADIARGVMAKMGPRNKHRFHQASLRRLNAGESLLGLDVMEEIAPLAFKRIRKMLANKDKHIPKAVVDLANKDPLANLPRGKDKVVKAKMRQIYGREANKALADFQAITGNAGKIPKLDNAPISKFVPSMPKVHTAPAASHSLKALPPRRVEHAIVRHMSHAPRKGLNMVAAHKAAPKPRSFARVVKALRSLPMKYKVGLGAGVGLLGAAGVVGGVMGHRHHEKHAASKEFHMFKSAEEVAFVVLEKVALNRLDTADAALKNREEAEAFEEATKGLNPHPEDLKSRMEVRRRARIGAIKSNWKKPGLLGNDFVEILSRVGRRVAR